MINDSGHEARRGYVGRSQRDAPRARRSSIGFQRQSQACRGGGDSQNRDTDDKPAVSLPPLSLSDNE